MTDYSLERFLTDLESLRVHTSSTQGLALKKPLLILLVISDLQNGVLKANRICFSDIEENLSSLILRFGGRRAKHGARPEQPFFHLGTSPFWHVHLPIVCEGWGETVPKSLLRDPVSYAQLPDSLFDELRTCAKARAEVADFILAKFWPETVWQDLRSELGLVSFKEMALPRDPNFTLQVLKNYGYRCCACGFDSLLNGRPFGIDAAHVKWRTRSGPDLTVNGLALCKLHHWALDRGVIGLDPTELRWLVSAEFVARDEVSKGLVAALHGCTLRTPSKDPPNRAYVEWHFRSVFVG